jgi:CheY-like chemotaxis protein
MTAFWNTPYRRLKPRNTPVSCSLKESFLASVSIFLTISTLFLLITAKAMVGDREKCIQCGASDYISKPVNTDQLLSLMRVWLYKG